MGKPKKAKKPGVGVDFKRVKHKVGKKLPRARNETNTDFTSRSINLPNQSVREDRSGAAVNYQNLTLKVHF
jgi:pre-rRNA-processing protein IPI1